MQQLILELKENNEDYEFYPTSKEMIQVIYPYMDNETVLDIGCGTCNFKKFMDLCAEAKFAKHKFNETIKEAQAKRDGERYYPSTATVKNFQKTRKYYVMEKSKILLEKLDKDAICLGTDFETNTLIDKKVDCIFCNPPYSKFEEWTEKIISEGNFKKAFLVIPIRWKDNSNIQNLLKHFDISTNILGTFDFLHAERQARAKVDVVMFTKNKNRYCKMQDFDEDAFDNFFNKQFGITDEVQEDTDSYRYIENKVKEKEQNITTALANCESEGKSKAFKLVELYSKDFQNLIDSLQAIMKLDVKVMEDFGLDVKKIKEALKTKLTGLKCLYWKRAIDELEEITDRLTRGFREKFFGEFEELKTLDFTLDNVYALILWVIKNANKYYDEQLIDFYKNVSDVENVIPYKSNQKLFDKEQWRYNKNNHPERNPKYVLDYRMILSSPFQVSWTGRIEEKYGSDRYLLQDIRTIARNLGFDTFNFNIPEDYLWGTKLYIYDKENDPFMEFKVYKNGNMHVKFNIEFTKALNVEVSRLLGWIKCKEDIEKEFPKELAKGAEKYFKTNYTCIGCNQLLLTTK